MIFPSLWIKQKIIDFNFWFLISWFHLKIICILVFWKTKTTSVHGNEVYFEIWSAKFYSDVDVFKEPKRPFYNFSNSLL